MQEIVQNPLFIVGMGRSGTTALQAALGRHPLVMTQDKESPIIAKLGTFFHDFFCNRRKQEYYEDSLQIPKDEVVARFRRLCFEACMGKENPPAKEYWCAKAFPDREQAEGLIELFPGVKFIYIHRNACDVIHSHSRFPGFVHEDFVTTCTRWVWYIEKYEYLSSLECGLEIRHEDLVAEAEAVMEKIFDFAGIPHSGKPLDFIRTTHVHPLDQATAGETNVREAFENRTPVHETWSEEKRRVFREICAETMVKKGYEMPF